jgi:4-hydroxybenzoyl-CoA reductase subunit alpha
MVLEKGRILNPNVHDYKLPSIGEIPITDMKSMIAGKLQTAPANANAVYDLVRVRIRDLPITPEKLLRALKERRQST